MVASESGSKIDVDDRHLAGCSYCVHHLSHIFRIPEQEIHYSTGGTGAANNKFGRSHGRNDVRLF